MTTAAAPARETRITTWIAPVVLLAIVAAVGWFIWWFLIGSMPRRHIVEVDPVRVQQESARAVGREITNRARQPDPRGIKRINDSEWALNSTTGSIQIRKIKNDYRLRATYHLSALLTPEERRWITAHRRFTTDAAMARQVGLTPPQVKQLRAIQPLNIMPLSEADQHNLTSLWQTYTTAPAGSAKQDAEKKLLSAVDELASSLQEAAKKTAQERLNQMKNLITQEMVAKLK